MGLPKLTENDIRRWADERSFTRGQNYYHENRILHPRRQEMVLKAQCIGSMSAPYRVQVVLNDQGIVSGTCSCPMGYACKHTVALLLAWIHEPDSFTEQEQLEASLERRSKAELIALIKKMLDHVPELEDLLQIQALGEVPHTQQIAPEVIRQQVSRAMAGGGYEWGASYGIAQTLHEIVGTGDSYAQREDWRNAATVYTTVAQAILEYYESAYDEEGEILAPVDGCVAGLGECLEAITDDVAREGILRALFEVYRWDVNFGGAGVGDEAPMLILEQATPEERQVVATWVRASLPTEGDAFTLEWRKRAYGGFLLELEADQLDDESFLRICRETGRIHDLVDRLLALGRVDEAVEVTQSASDYDLLELTNRFVAHQQDRLAQRLIQERAQTSKDIRLKQWLQAYAEAHHDPEQALQLAEELFWMQPTTQGYGKLQALAEPLQRWPALREAVLTRLAQDPRYAGLVVEIYLSEDQVALALKTLNAAESGKNRDLFWGCGAPLRIRVAQAAERDFPWESVDLYMRTIESLIAMRGRDNYATAARHLLRVREIHKRLGESARFDLVLQNLRDAHRNLPAFKDELNKAGL